MPPSPSAAPNSSSPDRELLAAQGERVRARLAADPAAWRVPVDTAEIFAIGGFLDAAECAHLRAMIDAVARPSPVFDLPDQSTYRTSYSGDVDRDDPFVRMIERRIDDLLGLPTENGETMQGQRYWPGQEFRPHRDWFDPAEPYWRIEGPHGGQRSWTAMIYLNDVANGGQTCFTQIGLSVPPQEGTLLTWNNMRPDGTPNPDTLHAAEPPVDETKYVITKWYRARSWL